MSDGNRPYRILGWHLKLAREQLSESVAEVSGAVEIDTEDLERIEQGKKRPSEDVLALLINHFNLADMEANSLWELAGYLSKGITSDDFSKLDLRIMYTDLVHMTVNDSGVVINFLQDGAINNQPLAVSRVGMSKDQARHMLSLLQGALEKSNQPETNLLPPKHNFLDDAKNNQK